MLQIQGDEFSFLSAMIPSTSGYMPTQYMSPPTPPPSPPLQEQPKSLLMLAVREFVSSLLLAIARDDGRFVGRSLSQIPMGLLRFAHSYVLDTLLRCSAKRTALTLQRMEALFRLRCRLYAEINKIPCHDWDTFRDYQERLMHMPFVRRLPCSLRHGVPYRPGPTNFWHARVSRRDLVILACLPRHEPPCFANAETHYASHYAYVCTTDSGDLLKVCGTCRRSPHVRIRGPIETAVSMYERRNLLEKLVLRRSNWCGLCGRAALFVLWTFETNLVRETKVPAYENAGEGTRGLRRRRVQRNENERVSAENEFLSVNTESENHRQFEACFAKRMLTENCCTIL